MVLEQKNKEYAEYLTSKKKNPAISITAEFEGKFYSDHSRPCDSSIPKKIRNKLKQLGNLYYHNGINIIGNCAEVNVAHQILDIRSETLLNEINFSNPVRPRTKQKRDTCGNCSKTFS